MNELNNLLPKKEDIGTWIKKYEKEFNTKINIKPHELFLIRLDGISFSKFTKNL